jgi:hypothetical protein
MNILSKKNLLYVFLIIHLLIFFVALKRVDFYFSYIIFSLISGYVIYFTLNRFDSYAVTYLFIFIYLGFWLKFSYFVIFNEYKLTYFVEQNRIGPHPNVENYPKVLIISSLSFCVIFINYFVYSKLFNKISFNTIKLKYLYFIFLKNKFLLQFLIFILFSILVLNFFFDFYYKGQLNPNLFSKIINITISILPYIILCLLIDYSTKIKNKIKYLFISFSTGFLENLSILSRAMIFAQFSIFIPSIEKIIKKIKIKKFFYFFTIILVIFVMSVFLVNYLRFKKNNDFLNKKENLITLENLNSKKNSSVDKVFKNIKDLESLFFYRWVGIDALINVLNNNERKVSNYFISNNNFYVREFMPDYDIGSAKVYIETIITPGFIAYSFYGNNLFFSFIILSLIIFAVFFLEKLTLLLTCSKTLSSFLSYYLVWRTIHLGHSMFNTLLLYFFLVLIPITLFIINYILKKNFYDK